LICFGLTAKGEIFVHNLLITGGEHHDRFKQAIKLTQELLCLSDLKPCRICKNCSRITSHTHPNFVLISPLKEDKEFATHDQDEDEGLALIKIEQVRQILTENYKTNFEKGLGVFLITHMHKATTSAANALLKIIEENQHHKVFIALAPSRASVLPTIASRLINYRIKPVLLDTVTDEESKNTLKKINTLSLRSRVLFCDEFSGERHELLKKLHTLSHSCHTMLRNQAINPLLALRILEALAKAQLDLQRNLNHRLVIERLFLLEWPQGIGA
jgi:DNA polymerase III gamma/tau subunit